jgi:hypothetical protein
MSPKNIQEEFIAQNIGYVEQHMPVRIIEGERETLFALFVK